MESGSKDTGSPKAVKDMTVSDKWLQMDSRCWGFLHNPAG